MRESSVNLLREFGRDQFCAKCGETADFIEAAIEKRITQTKYLADSEREQALDHNIACCALAVSARRHAGYIEKGYSDGLRLIQHGKNLTEIRTVDPERCPLYLRVRLLKYLFLLLEESLYLVVGDDAGTPTVRLLLRNQRLD